MNFSSGQPVAGLRMANGQRASATLPGLLVAASILLVVLGSLLSTHVFGMRMMQVIEAGRGVEPSTHLALRRLEAEVRSARQVTVGSGDERGFQQGAADVSQAGEALQIQPTDDASQFIRYFRDSQEGALKRIESGDARVKTIAQHVANTNVFTVEDRSGTVLTNVPDTHVIGVRLSFSKIVSTGTKVGAGEYFDAYDVKTKIAVSAW